MTQILSTTPGLYPLPDRAKDDLSSLKGHQKEDLISGAEDEEVQAVYEEAQIGRASCRERVYCEV